MNTEFDKAVQNLNDFLLENPELVQQQHELSAKLANLSPEDRILYLASQMKNNLSKINSLSKELKEELEKVKGMLE